MQERRLTNRRTDDSNIREEMREFAEEVRSSLREIKDELRHSVERNERQHTELSHKVDLQHAETLARTDRMHAENQTRTDHIMDVLAAQNTTVELHFAEDKLMAARLQHVERLAPVVEAHVRNWRGVRWLLGVFIGLTLAIIGSFNGPKWPWTP